jgi:hypothetical protein
MKETAMKKTFAASLLLALAFLATPARAADPEVLTSSVATAMLASPVSNMAVELQNLGPLPIYCKGGSATGLAVGTGREIRPGSAWVVRNGTAGSNIYCIASVGQATGAATIVQKAADFASWASPGIGEPARGQRFSCSLSALANSLTQCQALSAGLRYFVTDVVVGTTTATAGDYSIQTGTGTNCAAGTTALFPAASTSARFKAPIAANPSTAANFTTPLVTAAGHAICVIGTATNTINIQITGYVAP